MNSEGEIKQAVWTLRKKYQGLCRGYGFVVDVGVIRRNPGRVDLGGCPPKSPIDPDLREPQGSNPLGPPGPELPPRQITLMGTPMV